MAEQSKVVRTERSAGDYGYLSPEQHVLAKPNMYIGQVKPISRPKWLLDLAAKRLFYNNIITPPGLIHLFIEALSNAGDNADASRRMGVNPGSIEVKVDATRISIRNFGEPIPVVQRVKDPANPSADQFAGMWLPTFIFGVLRTSSNYDEKVLRLGAGVNGVGIKLVNLFSTEFMVQVGDAKNKRAYQGLWRKNMSEFLGEKITEGYTGPSFVEVSWVADFARFCDLDIGYDIRGGYQPEMFGIIAAEASSISLTAKIPVSVNDVPMDYRNIRDFARLYWPPEICDTAVLHREWPLRVLTAKEKKEKLLPPMIIPELIAKAGIREQEKIIANPPTPDCIPMIEIIVMDTPDAGVTLSFVNGQMTKDGGVHVNAAMAAISKEILDGMNSELEKISRKGKKDEDDKAKKIPKLTTEDIKPHISMILSARLPNPEYGGQTKDVLLGPTPTFHIDEKIISQIGRWKMVDRLLATLDAKVNAKLRESDGKRTRSKHLMLGRGEDGANEAGGPKSSQCVLYLPEGMSAAAYIKKRIASTPGKKDFSGYLPLRGKLPNATSMHKLRIAANKVFNSLKQMWNLQMEKDYSIPENRATLSYGFLCPSADADADAQHIIALLLQYINVYFPALLKCGIIGYLRTPVVRVYRGKHIEQRFFSMGEYERWIESTAPADRKGLEIKYYKGLGTHEDAEIVDDLTSAPVVIVVYDSTAEENLDIAFNKTRADDRKAWIQKWRDITQIDDVCTVSVKEAVGSIFRYQDISQFCSRELVTYMRDSLTRAIPCAYDGLKRSQRQAIFSALEKWKYGHGRAEAMGVSRFGNYAAAETHYHHGEKSICDTIIRLAQGFTGANNLPYFEGGQTGTRDEGGTDFADARYIKVSLTWWIKYVYDSELVKMISRRQEEDDKVEPKWLAAIVPMHVINGSVGIATGHSTYIPPHNPRDVIHWLIQRCSGVDKPPALIPWFKGFIGTVELFDPSIKPKLNCEPDVEVVEGGEVVLEEALDEGEEVADSTLVDELAQASKGKKGKRAVRTFGVFEILKKNKDRYDIKITELPIGRWMKPYKTWLKQLVEEKKLTDFHDGSDCDRPNYTLYGFQSDKGMTHYTLRLVSSFGMGNMTVIDTEGYPSHVNTVEDMMELFYMTMVQIFESQRRSHLEKIKNQIITETDKLKFIHAGYSYLQTRHLPVEERQGLDIFGRKRAELFADMDRMGFARELTKKVAVDDFTVEEMNAIKATIIAHREKFEEISKLTPQSMWSEKLQAFGKALDTHKY